AIYGVAAVLGIIHDALVMLAFDAVFRVEVDAGTIAAILTILGYSINDTIVNFDRARENLGLMRGSPLRTILDTSITQTLSRTFITSGATLLTVIALFVLTSGSIKNFSLNMIIGIVEGTYSTFISAFIVIEWSNWHDRRIRKRDLEKYGMAAPQAKPILATAGAPLAMAHESPDTVPEDAVEEPLSGSLQEPVGAAQPAQGSGNASAAPSATPQSASVAATGGQPAKLSQPGGQALPVGQRAGAAPALFGHSGSRKNKKHKRRHH
ncbi:MAG TPA: hypothetical protein VMM82_08465, partial [Spirochaetia bacterium]|nr:hypothetical protein [Spirochaetia bacterium]